MEAALTANFSPVALEGIKVDRERPQLPTCTPTPTIAPISIGVMAKRAVAAAG